MKHLFYLLFLCTLCQIGRAQSQGLIAGNLTDAESGKALAGAVVSLSLLDSIPNNHHFVADANGEFLFEQLTYGYYSLQIKMTGYAPLRIDSIYLRAERADINLPDVKLTRSASTIETITVYAEKPLIENKDGKITFNTSESALSNASTATELLKQTPLVSVDNDGKMMMKGKEVKVLIDDKPVEMDARQLQDLLESMPGSMIEKIEVLTTPPAEYANERGGVINIVTKKGKVGRSGRVNVNYGTRGEAGISAANNYRKNKTVFNATAGYAYNSYNSEAFSLRENLYADSSNFFKTTTGSASSNNRVNARINYEYSFNKFKNLSITGLLNNRNNDGLSDNYYSNINQYDELYRLSNRNVYTLGNAFNPSANFSYVIKTKKAGQSFKINGSIAYSANGNTRRFYQQYLSTDSSYTGNDSTQRQYTHSHALTRALRLGYDVPLADKKTSLSMGSSVNHYYLHNRLNSSYLKKPDSVYVNSLLLSNNFKFNQVVVSLRFALRYLIKKDFWINAGLQQEFTKTSFDIKGQSSGYNNQYYSTLPFANITRKWENGYSITGSYKRSIQRPGIGNLNPSIDYSDPYNTRFGNPYLKPYRSDNFDLSAGYFQKKWNINLGIGYNTLKDIFISLRALDSAGNTYTSWYNLSGRKEYEASMFGSLSMGKKMKVNGSLVYSYNAYSAYDRKYRRYHNGASVMANISSSYTFSPLLNFTGNVVFNQFANPQGNTRNRLSMNLGIQRKFLNKKLIAAINLIDPFSKQKNSSNIDAPNYFLERYSISNSRNLRFALAYNMSKQAKKPEKSLKPTPKK